MSENTKPSTEQIADRYTNQVDKYLDSVLETDADYNEHVAKIAKDGLEAVWMDLTDGDLLTENKEEIAIDNIERYGFVLNKLFDQINYRNINLDQVVNNLKIPDITRAYQNYVEAKELGNQDFNAAIVQRALMQGVQDTLELNPTNVIYDELLNGQKRVKEGKKDDELAELAERATGGFRGKVKTFDSENKRSFANLGLSDMYENFVAKIEDSGIVFGSNEERAKITKMLRNLTPEQKAVLYDALKLIQSAELDISIDPSKRDEVIQSIEEKINTVTDQGANQYLKGKLEALKDRLEKKKNSKIVDVDFGTAATLAAA